MTGIANGPEVFKSSLKTLGRMFWFTCSANVSLLVVSVMFVVESSNTDQVFKLN